MRGRSPDYAKLGTTALAVALLIGCTAPAAPPAATSAPAPAATTAPAAAPSAPAPAPSPAVSASPSTASVPSLVPAARSPAAAPAASGPGSSALTRLNIAYAQSMQFAPLFVAVDKGYFKDEGLDINLVTVNAGQDVLALTAAGQFDGMVAGMGVNFFNALARGLELKFIAPLSLSPADVNQKPTSALMVRKELVDSGAVKTVEDLKGKKFGLAGGPGSIASYQVHYELAPHGMSLKDVDIVNLDIPSQVVALKNGSIDASMPPEPYMTQILLDGTGVMFGDRLPLDFTSSGVVFGPNLIKNNRPAGEAFMRAILRAIRDIQGDDFNKPENMAIFSKYTQLPVDTLRQIARFNYPPNLSSNAERDILSMQQIFMEEGFANYKDPLPIDELLDRSFVDAAVARLGTYQPSR